MSMIIGRKGILRYPKSKSHHHLRLWHTELPYVIFLKPRPRSLTSSVRLLLSEDVVVEGLSPVEVPGGSMVDTVSGKALSLSAISRPSVEEAMDSS
jgi:hypothetical protein